MLKQFRELRRTIKKLGLVMVEEGRTGNDHIRTVVRAANGAEETFVWATTPGDYRGEKNGEARMRRFAMNNLLPLKLVETPPAPTAYTPPPQAQTQFPAAAVPDQPKEPAMTTNPPPVTPVITGQPRMKRRPLSQINFVRLHDWMKDATQIDGCYSLAALAQKAQAALDIEHIPDSSIDNALKAHGLKLQQRPLPAAQAQQREATEIMAAQLRDICTQLGAPLRGDFAALCKHLFGGA